MQKLNTIHNIIFDFGNVIVNLDRDGVTRQFAEQGVDVARFLGLSAQKGVFRDLELGLTEPDEWCRKVVEMGPSFQLAGHKLSLTTEGVKRAWNSMLAGIPLRRLQALTQLRQHYNLALLSNTNQIHVDYSFDEHFRKQGYEPRDIFHHIFLSHEMHLAKPGRTIFERVLEESGYKAEETLFIDDSQENCNAFARLGVQTFCPRWPDEWLGVLCPAVATIGFFDGVHRGHRYLIQQVTDEAASRRRDSLLVTFAEHPRQVLHADYVPELLTSAEEKLDLLSQTAADRIEMLHFTPELSRLTAKEFMQQILHDRLGVDVLVMGYDHCFGHGGGTWDEYQRWGCETGIEVVRAKPLPVADEAPAGGTAPSACCKEPVAQVSSSAIRRLLNEGRVDEAAQLLGHRYSLKGRVVSGHQVGRELGFPTANLQPSPYKLVPMKGVYAVLVTLPDNQRYAGMLNIGERPTIDNSCEQTIEVNLLDYEGDLYGKLLTLEFVAFLRHEQRFGSREELIRQMERDREIVKTLSTDSPSPQPSPERGGSR